MKPARNAFDCLRLVPNFKLPSDVLERAYKDVLRVTHPDQFVGKTGAEKLAASHQAANANEAYEQLKSPYHRAQILLDLQGHPFDETQSPEPSFLMEVMIYQEALQEEEIEPSLAKTLEVLLKEAIENLERAFETKNYNQVTKVLRRYKYLERLVFLAKAKLKIRGTSL